MNALLLFAMTAMALLGSVVPIPSSGPPPLPPIRWGLWESKVEGLPGMDGPSVTRSCVSAATWKGFMDSHGDDIQQCVWSNQRATAKTYNADMSCVAGKITGHGELTIDSPESFHYKMSIDIAQDTAHPKHFDVTATSKFLSTSCAGLKPGEGIDVWE